MLYYLHKIYFGGTQNKIMEMELWLAIPVLIIGFMCLVKGADWFVDGAAGIAAKLHVPQLIIGLTIVSFGTSAPELATSLISSFQGSADIAVGNVIGSNITNILLILGLAAIICPLVVQKSARYLDFPVLLGASGLLLWFGLNDNVITAAEGWIMFAISMVYTIILIVMGFMQSKNGGASHGIDTSHTIVVLDKDGNREVKTSWYERMKEHAWFLIIITVVGLALVVVGALYAVIPAATSIAKEFGVSEKIIGLTIVAIGTSLPELVTCVIAAKKGETDIAVGDIVGSNIFNILRTLGLSAAILPLAFESSFLVDGLIALGAALLLASFGYMKSHKVQRWGGVVMLLGFVAYYVYLFALA